MFQSNFSGNWNGYFKILVCDGLRGLAVFLSTTVLLDSVCNKPASLSLSLSLLLSTKCIFIFVLLILRSKLFIYDV